jgi:hypothetical protein
VSDPCYSMLHVNRLARRYQYAKAATTGIWDGVPAGR